MKDTISFALINLLRFEIFQEPLTEEARELISTVDKTQLYTLSLQHDLAHLVGNALEKCQLLPSDDPAAEKFDMQKMMAFFRYKQLTYEYERICKTLEVEGIRFLPLKGCAIRKLYPEEWMRVSCDIDILIDPENVERAEKALKSTLKYYRSGQTNHDISLYSSNDDVHLELHFALLDGNYLPEVSTVLERVWDYTSPVSEGSCQMQLSSEMLYFYHVAHLAKHIQHGGCGIRFFLDAKLILDRLQPDPAIKNALLEEAALLQFESCAVSLAQAWFGDQSMSEELWLFHRFIVDGGSYGTIESKLTANSKSREKSFFKYILYRVFPPKQIILDGYPVVKRHPWLVPIFYLIRPFHRLFARRRTPIFQEIKTQANLSKEKMDSVGNLFAMLGIRHP